MKKTVIAIAIVSFALVQTIRAQQPVKLKAILEVAASDSGEQLGAYVKGVGDLNKDGYADVAVSARGKFQTYIYYGGKTMSQTPSLTLWGGGHIVSGDFRGDGWIDLAIEIPFHDTVLVYYNGTQGLDTIPDLVLTMNSDYFGQVMATGDFYGNGYTDIAIATPDANLWQDTTLYLRGRVFIYAGGLDMGPVPADTLIGDTTAAALGTDMTAGDVDADGRDEVIALGYKGYYYISVFGNDSGLHMNRDYYIDSRHVPGGFGGNSGNVACFDAEGDGIKDILVSKLVIFKGGQKVDTLPTYFVTPPYDSTTMGSYPRVSGGGDYNGDGVKDMLVTSQIGVFGAISGFFVMLDRRGHPGQYAGYRVYADYGAGTVSLGKSDNAGDVNGDGVDDIISGNGGWPYTWSYGFFGIYSGDTAMVTAVKEPERLPKEFELEQNYPNPFNPSTAISYQLSAASNATLKIYDALGREVVTLVDNERQSPGTHTVYWSGTNHEGERVSSGTYFYQLITDNGTQTRKAVYLK